MESDERESSPHAPHDLLTELPSPTSTNPPNPSASSSTVRLTSPPIPAWFASASSRSSPSHGLRPPGLIPRRSASAREHHPSSLPDAHYSSAGALASTSRTTSPSSASHIPLPPNSSSLFATPSRSIFASGPPTASVSSNTAHASMSSPPPSATHLPLSALSSGVSSSAGPALRSSSGVGRGGPNHGSQAEDSPPPARRPRFALVEKTSDDPSAAVEDGPPSRSEDRTRTALSNLFAAPETGPSISRHNSYVRTPSGTQYTRASFVETTPLPSHLYNRGLLSGRHSDVTVIAFGSKYPLHRLLLDRAPFFYSAFSEPWRESSAKEITLHPEDVDPNITQAAFELALKRLYGCHRVEEEDKEPIGLFATGCWLEMIDLIEASINSLLRQMCPANLSSYIRFVTSSYYGKNGDRVLAAAKAMLCREGYEMPLRYFDGIPGDIIREIVGSDGFYVPDEWERWILAQRIFNRRLKSKAVETGLLDLDGKLRKARPKGMNFMAVRFDTVYRNSFGAVNAGISDGMDEWLGIYTCPDIAPLLVLLDEGVHYVHLGFEQLQIIREQRDVLGLPLLPEKVISNALWMAMEMRQRVVNARKSDMELGLSQVADASEDDELLETPTSAGLDTPATNAGMSEKAAGKQVATEEDEIRDEEEGISGSWDGNGKPRKFWIPQVDATYILGGDLEPVADASPTIPRSRHMARISASLDPQDAQWATDFASGAQDRPETPLNPPSLDTTEDLSQDAPPPQATFSHYPPFRFAAEFPASRFLKDHKRVYSHTVWYAGSQWNIYLQKKETAKHTQLGVYLHRERPNIDGMNGSADDSSMVGIMQSSVDERIGHLERELIMRGPPRSRTRNLTDPAPYDSHTRDASAENAPRAASGTSHDLDTLSGLLRNQATEPGRASSRLIPRANLPLERRVSGPNADYETRRASSHRLDADGDDDTGLAAAAALAASGRASRRARYPALPPYVDRRASIRTYFKIYTPSKGGRVLSVYESTPDDSFPFGQSFGWKSKDLIMDDGFGPVGGGGGGGGSAGSEGTARPKEPRLRFMVVLGNI